MIIIKRNTSFFLMRHFECRLCRYQSHHIIPCLIGLNKCLNTLSWFFCLVKNRRHSRSVPTSTFGVETCLINTLGSLPLAVHPSSGGTTTSVNASGSLISPGLERSLPDTCRDGGITCVLRGLWAGRSRPCCDLTGCHGDITRINTGGILQVLMQSFEVRFHNENQDFTMLQCWNMFWCSVVPSAI